MKSSAGPGRDPFTTIKMTLIDTNIILAASADHAWLDWPSSSLINAVGEACLHQRDHYAEPAAGALRKLTCSFRSPSWAFSWSARPHQHCFWQEERSGATEPPADPVHAFWPIFSSEPMPKFRACRSYAGRAALPDLLSRCETDQSVT